MEGIDLVLAPNTLVDEGIIDLLPNDYSNFPIFYTNNIWENLSFRNLPVCSGV